MNLPMYEQFMLPTLRALARGAVERDVVPFIALVRRRRNV